MGAGSLVLLCCLSYAGLVGFDCLLKVGLLGFVSLLCFDMFWLF